MKKFGLLAGLMFGGLLSGAPLCTTASLAVYTASGFACDLGGATWSGFSLAVSGFTASPVLTAADITVNPSYLSPTVGFLFTGAFSTGPGDQGTYSIGYNGVGNTVAFSDTTVSLQGATITPGGSNPVVSAIKIVRVAPGGALLTTPPFPSVEFTSGTNQSGSFFRAFATSSATINVVDNLTLTATGGTGLGTASATGIGNYFLTPEPATMLLFGSGLLSVAILGRRRARR